MGPEEDKWIYKSDYTYLGITTHTIKCPKCGNEETFHGDIPPKRCYFCDNVNYDVLLKIYKDYGLRRN